MIELRWKLDEEQGFKHDGKMEWKGERWKLQWREIVGYVGTTEGMVNTWSDWTDVPYVSEE